MNILFLDDDLYRTKNFRSKMPSATTVETAVQTIDKLKEQEWDWVFLDHDLGDETFVDSDRPDTGMEVVRWIEENKPIINKGIIVHTLNDGAGQNMVSKLEAIGYHVERIPFTALIYSDFAKFE